MTLCELRVSHHLSVHLGQQAASSNSYSSIFHLFLHVKHGGQQFTHFHLTAKKKGKSWPKSWLHRWRFGHSIVTYWSE